MRKLKLKDLYCRVNKKKWVAVCLALYVMLAGNCGEKPDRNATRTECKFEKVPRLVASRNRSLEIEWETSSRCASAVFVLPAERRRCRGNSPGKAAGAIARAIVRTAHSPETGDGKPRRTRRTALLNALESDREYRYLVILPGENNFRTGKFRTAQTCKPLNRKCVRQLPARESARVSGGARRRFRVLPFIQNLLGDEVTITFQTREDPGFHAALAIPDECPATAGKRGAYRNCLMQTDHLNADQCRNPEKRRTTRPAKPAARILTSARRGNALDRETFGNVSHARLRGLVGDAAYRYYVLLEGKDRFIGGNDYSFIAPAVSGERFSFYVYGDSRTLIKERRAVIRTMRQYGDRLRARGDFPRFVLGTGDYAATGCDERFVRWLVDAGPLLRNVPLFASPGNHERWCRSLFKRAPLFPRYFVNPPGLSLKQDGRERTVYSFDYRNSRFISLDIVDARDDGGLRSPKIKSFLAEKLRAPKHIEHIFLFYHAPMMAQTADRSGHLGRPGHPGSAFQVKTLAPLLSRAAGRVAAIFTGHNHFYERSHSLLNVGPARSRSGIVFRIERTRRRGFTHIITGGAGAPLNPVPARFEYEGWLARAKSAHHFLLIQVNGKEVTGAAIDVNGEEFDTFTIRAP